MKVSAEISMSLDGFIAGPNDSPEEGLGEGGERLHDWAVDLESFKRYHGDQGGEENRDSEILDESFRDAGAFVMGRRMFDFAEDAWGSNPPFHHDVFVVTHRPHPPIEKEGGTTFTFVTEGIEHAFERAREAAGEQNVSVAGGADVIRQGLKLGLLDELQIHVVPFLLGGGRPLFEGGLGGIELEIDRVVDSPAVTHVRYRVQK